MARQEATAEAFERLVRDHRAEIFRALRRWSDTREEAEDLTQIAFLDAYRALSRGARPGSPRAWLHAIARNAAIRRFRKRRLVEVELDPELPAEDGDEGPTLADLKGAFRSLTPNQRCALLLREVGGLSGDEIGSALGVSRGAVETLLFRARRDLRAELGGDEEGRRKKRSVLTWLAASLFGSLGRRAAVVGVTAIAGGAVTVATTPLPSASAHRAAHTAAVVPVVRALSTHRIVALHLHLPSVVSGSAVVVRSHPVVRPRAPKPNPISKRVVVHTVAPVRAAPSTVSAPRPAVHVAPTAPVAAAPESAPVSTPEAPRPAAPDPVPSEPEQAAPAAQTSAPPPAGSGSVVDTAHQVDRTVGDQVDSAVQQATSTVAPVTSALPPAPTATVPDVTPPSLPAPPPVETPSLPTPPAIPSVPPLPAVPPVPQPPIPQLP
jgi:RNA polymerase sigma-70 factor, ECF subfamily